MSGARSTPAHANNFDFLRFLAAAMVIVSHSFVLTGSTFEPLVWATRGFDTLGGLGVTIFFVMSGFLITQSWHQEPRLARFLGKRALRILPALAAAILVAAFVLGPIVTSLDLGTYISHPETRDYLWSLSIFKMGYFLPGVFEGHPFSRAVNGSLWTIPIEVCCYLAAGALGLLGILRRPALVALVLAALLVLDGFLLPAGAERGWPFTGPLARSYARFAGCFFSGAVLYLVPRRLLRSASVVIGLAILLAVSLATPFAQAVGRLALPVLVLASAHASTPVLHGFARYGDFSYGMYLYAFPIQQLFIEAVPIARTPGGLLALSFPATVALAAVSWHVLEAPALRLKDRIGRASPAIPVRG